MTIKKVGDSLTWTSGANGTWLEKRGEVVAIVPGRQDLLAVLRRLDSAAPRSRCKAQAVSVHDRYLVRVPRGAGRSGCDYYAPQVATIDNGLMAARAREKRET